MLDWVKVIWKSVTGFFHKNTYDCKNCLEKIPFL
jgi:hypothetical protein